jgi:hypothetical protein
MIFDHFQPSFNSLARQGRSKFSALVTCLVVLIAVNDGAWAAFVSFNGDTSAESNWQQAAGSTVLEDFESYSAGTQISSLPALGIEFDPLAGGGHPHAYLFGGTPHGPMHLGNFPNGITEINRWDDIVLRVLPGYEITALGFWNGDGQSDTLVATAYDVSGTVLGSIGAFKGTFSGFTSDIGIARVVFNGNTGDGWNHLDGLQTNAVSTVPVPAAVWLFGSGLVGLAGLARRRMAV